MSISLTELLGAFLGVMIIIGIAYVIFKLTGLFGNSGQEYQSTIANFDLLGQRIENLIKDRDYASRDFAYYLGEGYTIVGFSYKDLGDSRGMTCNANRLTRTRENAKSLCGKSCICLYKKSNFDNENDIPSPIKCRSFDKNMIFLAPSESEQEYAFCGEQTIFNPLNRDKDYYNTQKSNYNTQEGNPVYRYLVYEGRKTKEIYLDKYKTAQEAGGEVLIFMAEYKEDASDSIYKRKVWMEQKYSAVGIPVELVKP